VTRLASILFIVLLTACGPSGDAAKLESETSIPSTGMQTGADGLRLSGFASLAGLRVGLIANQTSVSGGQHLADLIYDAPDVTLAALFGPEHGLRGEADAGAVVTDGIDDRTGTPVYSLYGERRSPPPEVLGSLDILIFDIQDIGARFYTYISTMGLAMKAAADAGVPFMVLDRPNPLGGTLVDGFVLDEGFESFVGAYPIPVQHGMTVGELAQMVKGLGWIEGLEGLDLRIEKVQGWARADLWSSYGSDWIATSPNIPTFETALVYAGMCLLEATTVNEGRGTASPFMTIGAPGLDGPALARLIDGASLSGLRIEATSYTPVSMPGKSTNPRHRDELVSGIAITVTDPALVRPLALGVSVLAGLVSLQGPDVLVERTMSRLGGTGRLYEALVAGEPAEAVVALWAQELEAFRIARKPYLLYD
jgi:uncharacterized protein YbbC (DUF1343 family)